LARFPSYICERLVSGSDRQAALWRLALIAVVGVAAYANTFTMAFNFDDNFNIVSANALRNLGPLRELFDLRPIRAVGLITFAINYRLHGSSVVGYHVVNLLIHLGSAWLLAALVLTTFRTPIMAGSDAVLPDHQGRRVSRVAALFAGLLFVAHPIQTQAVTYLVQRYASLATLWYLLAVFCYARARLAGEDRRWWGALDWGAGTLLAAALAMKTKEISFTLPFALVLYEFCFFRNSWQKRLAILGGGIAAFLLILWVKFGMALVPRLLDIWAGMRMQTAMSRADYLCSQFPVIVTYLRLMIWPAGQSIEHQATVYKTFWTVPVVASFTLLSTLLLAGCLLVRRAGKGNPALRLAGFGILWFFLTLTVESSIIPIVDLIFEHRVYLPFAGACMAVAVGIALAAERVSRPGLVYGAAGTLIVVLAIVTFVRNEVWRTPVSLWRDAAVKAPTSSRSWNNLAYAYLREKRPAEALPALIRAIELNPGPPDAWNNIGIALEQIGRYQGRLQRNFNMFRSAEDLKNQTVWFANAYNNLGLAHEFLGQPAAAIQSYQKAASYRPDLAVAYFNLGLSALMLNNQPLAEEQYLRLLRLNSQFAAELGRLLGH